MATARDQRIAEEVKLAITDALIRQEVKDPRVWDAGIITITHVKVTGDLRTARALFMVHGASEATMSGIKQALNKATGLWRRKIGERVRMKFTPTVTFEVDRVFESEARVERVFADLSDERKAKAKAEAEEAAGTETGGDASKSDE